MPNKDYTHITLVVDRSGSMAGTAKDAQGGLNTLIQEQSKLPGKCTVTLVQFDDQYEVVHDQVPINSVGEYRLRPRGGTALLDAIGKGINSTGEALSKMKEEDRPGLVLFVIVTDGDENSSKEFDNKKIREMIKLQEEVYKWQFNYIGANQDAFSVASRMGMSMSGVANYVANSKGTQEVYTSASLKVGRMRSTVACGGEVDNRWTQEEQDAMLCKSQPALVGSP